MIDEVLFHRPHIRALAIASDRKRDDDTINPSLNWPDCVCVDVALLLVQRRSIVRELDVGIRICRSICRRFFRCLDHVLYFDVFGVMLWINYEQSQPVSWGEGYVLVQVSCIVVSFSTWYALVPVSLQDLIGMPKLYLHNSMMLHLDPAFHTNQLPTWR